MLLPVKQRDNTFHNEYLVSSLQVHPENGPPLSYLLCQH